MKNLSNFITDSIYDYIFIYILYLISTPYFLIIVDSVTSITELKTSFKSIFSNSPLANSTSNLELDDISDINLSSLLRSLNAIKISSFFHLHFVMYLKFQ